MTPDAHTSKTNKHKKLPLNTKIICRKAVWLQKHFGRASGNEIREKASAQDIEFQVRMGSNTLKPKIICVP